MPTIFSLWTKFDFRSIHEAEIKFGSLKEEETGCDDGSSSRDPLEY